MHFFSVSDRRYCFDEVTRNCFQVDQASEDALRIFEASGRTVNSKLLTKSLAAKGYDQTTIAELEDDIDEYQRLSERTFLTDGRRLFLRYRQKRSSFFRVVPLRRKSDLNK